MFKILVLFLISLQVYGNGERPYTFSLAQEKVLAEHPKVLSFLYHMTRNRLTFEEMSQKYALASTPRYASFLADQGLIRLSETGEIEFLFANPYGAWNLQNKAEGTVLHRLRKEGIDRLVAIIGEKATGRDEASSPVWITNTYRLTEEEYKNYKQELQHIRKKYTDLGERNLLNGVEHRVIWVVQLADCIEREEAERSHLLFGPVDEFESLEFNL